MGDHIQLSVRALVEYAYRSGDIESGFHVMSSMTEGTKAHQRIQKQYGEQDQKEVYVSAEIVMDDLLFVIDGRCDGLLIAGEDGGLIVDEIKSTAGRLPEEIDHTYPVHWAQAKCYAYMIAKDRGLQELTVQLTYVQVESEEERRFLQRVTYEELTEFVHEMVRSYYACAAQQVRHRELRNRSIQELAFPFAAYREGQRKLAGAVYQTIAEGHKLFAKAPTGIGKTISTIFPSVKAIGAGLLQRFVYLTAKTITRTAAEEAFALLQTKGLHLQVVTMTAKEKICFQEEVRCSKEHCPYADGYYDRINEALLDLRSNETLITREVVEVYARKHRVCPFEFALDAAYGADAMICDYNYVFDPRVSLKRMFEEQKRQTALLIDEAHNLVDRAREMYSSDLNKADFLEMQRAFKGVNGDVHGAAKAVNQYYIAQRKALGEQRQEVVESLPEPLVSLVEQFAAAAEKELLSPAGGSVNPELLDLYFRSQSFVRISELYDERFVTYTESLRGDMRTKLFCLDPSHLLEVMSKGYRAMVFFSATLMPLNYYMDMLGAGENEGSYSIVIPSPFSADQLEVTIAPLSTRYQDRERTKFPIAALIAKVTQEKQGNYLVFFPSYAYMNDAYEQYQLLVGSGSSSVRTMVQGPGMTEEEREGFLAAFQEGSGETLVGFAVMGGIFSEGIDLVGDRLTGVVVVGVGLPQVGLERDIMKAYFDRTDRNGFDYAFLYPGMNKVLQAGGRLIRSEHDRGSLLLIDDRYLQPHYNRLLPPEWLNYRVLRASEDQMDPNTFVPRG
ncbi:helicase C-terminal domain-containing protein [Paenibacillus sp. CF384]|uniref:helicase C-terminal domain-containing protein n=1 Tax=Paenibacillus sp. CF384 TaxID=1884382 RepID=UPI000896A7BE|nr:helicase C-terminal domain-containing protein [Paenibacillus sp. CF384]SDW94376.1 Rad3-related DNA helicase [Paenibacillus sp. CF384]